MQKKVIETPKYETVQVGVNEKEIWVTSDGLEFDDEKQADYHEFYGYKLNKRGIYHLPIDATILDLEKVEDLNRYENDYCYDCEFRYNKTELSFPNTFVLYEECHPDSDDSYYGMRYLYCVTLDEYKEMLIKGVNELK